MKKRNIITEQRIKNAVASVLREAFEEGNDTNRAISNDKFADYTGKIRGGAVVHVGYINYSEIKSKDEEGNDVTNGGSSKLNIPSAQRYLNPDNTSKLKGMMGGIGDDKPMHHAFLDKGVSGMDDYMNDTNPKKKKTYNFGFNNDRYMVVKFQEYSINWRDAEGLAKFYAGLNDERMTLRHSFGFGQDGAEGSWREKYNGSGLLPVTKHSGNTYKDSTNDGDKFQASWTDPKTGKGALRQAPTPYGKPVYFLFDNETGEAEIMDQELFFHLKNGFGRPAVEKAMEEISAEEQEFKEQWEAIKERESSVWNLVEDKVLFISYSINKQKYRWVNKEVTTQFANVVSQLDLNGRIELQESRRRMAQKHAARFRNRVIAECKARYAARRRKSIMENRIHNAVNSVLSEMTKRR